jgi:hypothetical protein
MQRDWRTAADVKPGHDHLSRHHAGPETERARFDIGLGTSTYASRLHAATHDGQSSPRASVLPPFAPSPLAPQPGGLVRIISMAVRDHASLVTHSNHNLVGITVIKPSQKMNMCDDVSVNMSLFGNERETPSIRSRTASEVDNSP